MTMAERLIRESDVLKNIDEWLETVGYATIGKNLSYYAELKGCIADATTVEAKPVVHAHWEPKKIMARTPFARNYYCSNCGYEPFECKNFCPNCGALMDKIINNE